MKKFALTLIPLLLAFVLLLSFASCNSQSAPAESVPGESRVAESTPAVSQPAESQPAVSQPSESRPSESRPSVSEQGEGQAAESQPAESKPGEINSSEVENPPASSTVNLMNGIEAKAVVGKTIDERFISSQYDFAARLLKSCYEPGKNTLVSPTSAVMALAMTANGACGDTLDEMLSVIGGGMSMDDLNRYLYTYASAFADDEILKSANSIWVKNGFNVYEEFLRKNADYYNAGVFGAAFDGETAKDVNNWVSEKTDGMITKLYESFDDSTVSALINALCFKGEWEEKLEEFEGRFVPYGSSDDEVADMLRGNADGYIEGDGEIGFIKNYKGGRYAFVGILPNGDIDAYVDSLTSEKLASLMGQTVMSETKIVMPKFSFNFGASLKDKLKDMGMKKAFLPGTADLTAFAPSAVGDLYIGSVIQKTFISVDAEGTKAAAATGVTVDCESCGNSVTLNKPFVFAIVDTQTMLPIFIGTYLGA